MAKGDLHVIDECLRRPDPKKLWRFKKRCAQVASGAGRFILTDEASHKLGLICKNTCDLMLRNHQFAIQPVEPASYLELNLHLFHEALGAKTTASHPGFSPLDSDERVGYLMENDLVHCFVRGRFDGECVPGPLVLRKVGSGHVHRALPVAFSPIGYDADTLMSKTQEILRETMEWNRLGVLLGSGLHHMPDEETRQAYLNNWDVDFAYNFVGENTIKYMLGGAGELRTLHAMLLVLNQPQVIHYTSVGRSVGLSRGKRTVYHSHSVIDIDLGKRKQYRRLFTSGTHATPARHRVKGHFVHYHQIRGCEHEWPLAPERIDPPAWTCRKCGTLRVWKANFMRGDAAKGFVTNEYNVEGEAA